MMPLEKEFDEFARLYRESNKQTGYVVDFDMAWRVVGYSRKDKGKNNLRKVDRKEYIIAHPERVYKGRGGDYSSEAIKLTWEGFDMFSMVAQTPGSVAFRRFFIRLKRIVDARALVDPITDGKRSRAVDQLVDDVKRAKRDDSEHDQVRDDFARRLGGDTEVCNAFGRADIQTGTHVFEVKHSSKFSHALGQALCYQKATDLRPGVICFGPPLDPRLEEMARELRVSVLHA